MNKNLRLFLLIFFFISWLVSTVWAIGIEWGNFFNNISQFQMLMLTWKQAAVSAVSAFSALMILFFIDGKRWR